MIMVIGNMRLQPGAFAQIEGPVVRLLQKSRAGDGCISCEFSRDVENPGLIRFAERWRDMAAFDTHNAQLHMADFRAAAWPYLTEIPDVSVCEARMDGAC